MKYLAIIIASAIILKTVFSIKNSIKKNRSQKRRTILDKSIEPFIKYCLVQLYPIRHQLVLQWRSRYCDVADKLDEVIITMIQVAYLGEWIANNKVSIYSIKDFLTEWETPSNTLISSEIVNIHMQLNTYLKSVINDEYDKVSAIEDRSIKYHQYLLKSLNEIYVTNVSNVRDPEFVKMWYETSYLLNKSTLETARQLCNPKLIRDAANATSEIEDRIFGNTETSTYEEMTLLASSLENRISQNLGVIFNADELEIYESRQFSSRVVTWVYMSSRSNLFHFYNRLYEFTNASSADRDKALAYITACQALFSMKNLYLWGKSHQLPNLTNMELDVDPPSGSEIYIMSMASGVIDLLLEESDDEIMLLFFASRRLYYFLLGESPITDEDNEICNIILDELNKYIDLSRRHLAELTDQVT